jgi:hypothetical protein
MGDMIQRDVNGQGHTSPSGLQNTMQDSLHHATMTCHRLL